MPAASNTRFRSPGNQQRLGAQHHGRQRAAELPRSGRNLGSDDSIELEDSLEILSGSGGRYLRLPQGTTGQRPTGAAGMLRLNTTDGSA